MRIRVSVSVSGFVLPGALEGESSRASHGAAFVPKLERMACVGLGLGLELVLVLGGRLGWWGVLNPNPIPNPNTNTNPNPKL